VPEPGDDDDDDDDDGAPGELTEGAELLPLAGITLEEAIAAAEAHAAANDIHGELGEVELEDEDGRLIFEVEIGDEDIEVDAQTGEVIPDDEGDDDDDEGGGGGDDDDDDDDDDSDDGGSEDDDDPGEEDDD
jgi:uncharacterized membrane protein YkoI